MRLVLLGAPGSGKGTQAKQLMAERGIPQISTGDLLRAAVAAGSELGQRAKAAMDAGELVADEVVLGMIRERLAQSDCEPGFILDGFPRNTAQAEALDQLLSDIEQPLDRAVLMDVSFDILMKRLTGRRTCSVSGKVVNIYFSPSSDIEAIEKAGGELTRRDDDTEEVIGNRLDVYRAQTEPLVAYYRDRSLLVTVAAEGQIEEVYERLIEAVS